MIFKTLPSAFQRKFLCINDRNFRLILSRDSLKLFKSELATVGCPNRNDGRQLCILSM